MRRSVSLPLTCALATSLIPSTWAQAQAPDPTLLSSRQWLLEKVPLHLDKAGVDEHLEEVVRLTGYDFLADATRFPQKSAPLSGEWMQSRVSLLSSITRQRGLALGHLDKGTLLLWAKPDLVPLARLVAAGQGIRVGAVPKMEEVDAALTSYLKREHGWDGHSLDFEKEVHVGDLPASLRALIVPLVQQRILGGGIAQGELGWFAPRVWERAHLVVRQLPGQDGRALFLHAIKRNLADERGHAQAQPSTTSSDLTLLDYDFGPRPDAPLDTPAAQGADRTQGPVVPDALSPPDLTLDEALSVKVSFQARRRELAGLLRDVQQQSGVALLAAPGVGAAKVLISARVREMPLAKFMQALCRLYGVQWTKGPGKTYTLHDSDRSPAEQAILSLGDPGSSWWDGPYWMPDLGREVAQVLPRGGLLVSELPEDLQQQVRASVEDVTAQSILRTQNEAREEVVEQYLLKIGGRPFQARAKGGGPVSVPLVSIWPAARSANSDSPILTFGLGAATAEAEFEQQQDQIRAAQQPR